MLICHFPHFNVKKQQLGNIYKMLASVFSSLSSPVKVLFVFPSLSPLHSSLLSAHFHLPSHPNRRGLWGIDFSSVLPGETVGSAIAHGARGCWWMGKRRAAALTMSFSVGCSAYHTKHSEQGRRRPDGINTLTEKNRGGLVAKRKRVIPRNRNDQHLEKTSLFQGDEQDHTLPEKQLLVVLNISHCYLWLETSSSPRSWGQRAK